MVIGTIMTAIVSTLLYLKGYLLIDLFTSDAQVQEIGLSLIHFLVPTLITYITIEILSGTLRGVGDAWMPLIMTGIGVCCLRVIWIIFFLPQYRSILAAAFCYPLSWTITSIAFVIYYFFFIAISVGRRISTYSSYITSLRKSTYSQKVNSPSGVRSSKSVS